MARKVYTKDREVGIRDFRAQLKRWLEEVKKGRDVVITERGEPVAKLVGISEGARILQRMIDEGVATPAREPRTRIRDLGPPVIFDSDPTEYLLRERGR